MPFWKKSRTETDKKQNGEKSLYPVLFVMDTLNGYRKELVQKEVDSLQELGLVKSSFDHVLKEAGNFQDKLQDFGQTFSNIEQVSNEFAAVKGKVDQSVQQAQEEVAQLKSSSMQVEEHFAEMKNTFEDLQEAVEKIKSCMSEIVSIANQTNILALNAAVEAARAGEQGRGFAVVASEVRTLASRSAQAAKEIEGLISESVRLIDLGSDEVATAGKTMSTIVDAVASVTHIMQEIAAASDEQSRGITQVSQAISEMDKVTQQNASLVEEASAAAVSLEEQAARLTEAVDVFRLHKHSVSAEPRGAGEPVSFATV